MLKELENVKIVFAGTKAISTEEYIELLEREVDEFDFEDIKEAFDKDNDSIYFEDVDVYKDWRNEQLEEGNTDLINYSHQVAVMLFEENLSDFHEFIKLITEDTKEKLFEFCEENNVKENYYRYIHEAYVEGWHCSYKDESDLKYYSNPNNYIEDFIGSWDNGETYTVFDLE